MPKVTDEYIQYKKAQIVDAAYRLCLKKTVSTVTMQDVINETGLSQGGIYRFYKDIDEILAAMIDRLRKESGFIARLDKTFQEITGKPVQEMVYSLFRTLGEAMEQNLMSLEKIDFEMNILAINTPARINHIMSYTKEGSNKEYLQRKTSEFFFNVIQEKQLRMRISPEELVKYIASAYNGIQMTSIVNSCYRQAGSSYINDVSPVTQMRVLAETVLYFFGEL